MQEPTGCPPTVVVQKPDADTSAIMGLSKDIVAAHHAGDMQLEVELVAALADVYFRNGRFDEAGECWLSVIFLRHSIRTSEAA